MKHKTWAELLHARTTSSEEEKYVQQDEETGQGRNARRDNLVHTILLVAAAFACGLVTSQRGPSILDLGHISHAAIQPVASLFALGAGGYLTGCMATGLIVGRLHTAVFLFWSLLGMSITTVALPWCRQYAAMATVYFFSLLCVGCVETGCYAEVARRWRNCGSTVVQLLQLFFVVGGVVSPGMTQFFLMPRSHEHGEMVSDGNNSDVSSTQDSNLTLKDGSINQWTSESNGVTANKSHDLNSDTHPDDRVTYVQYAYIITAAVSILVAVAFIVRHIIFRDEQQLSHQKTPASLLSSSTKQSVRDAKVYVLLLVAVFFFMVSAVEESIHQFLFTFLVHEDHWSTHMSGWVTSWFWCGVLLVRVALYFLPDRVADEMILALSCTILPCTLAGLQASVVFSSSDGVWACVFFAGMSSSLIFPVSFSWLHCSLDQRSSAVSVMVMISTSLAGIVNPLLLGHLFRSGSKGGFPYVLIVEACLGLLVFLMLYVLSRKLTATWRSVPTRVTMEKEIFSDKFEEIHEDDKNDVDGS